jgi:hypothetical protein
VAWATNGRIDKDGLIYRAAYPVAMPGGGQTLQQAQVAVKRVANLPLVIASGWQWSDVLNWLRLGKGVILAGQYDSLPRAYRYQADGAFAHRMWCSHYSATSGIRTWDPLNPDIHAWGRWLPSAVVKGFALSLSHVDAGYVPLQPL